MWCKDFIKQYFCKNVGSLALTYIPIKPLKTKFDGAKSISFEFCQNELPIIFTLILQWKPFFRNPTKLSCQKDKEVS
jgi:hypothetical protein